MAGGYKASDGDDLQVISSALKDLSTRLSELEAPTGTSVNSLVAQVQQAIADINTTVIAAIALTSYDAATIDSKDAARVAKTGDTISGDLFIPGMTPAVSSYTIMYQDGTGRLSKGASSEKYKTDIGVIDPADIGALFPEFKRWRMIDGDGVWRYGYTAEQLAAHPDTEQFAIYERVAEIDEDGNVIGSHLARDADGNPIPESIDFIGFMAAQIAQMNRRLEAGGL